MSKPLLSILIPVAPDREERLAIVLSRLTLNKRLFPDHTFEVIVCDGGSTGAEKELCETLSKAMPIKYIYVPVCRFINPAYIRNIMLRVAEGDVIGMIDVDTWPSEHLVYGMLNPFIDDADFRFIEIIKDEDIERGVKETFQENPALLHNQYVDGILYGLNRGYIVGTESSSVAVDLNQIPSELTKQQNAGLQIHSVYNHAGLPHGKNQELRIWAARRNNVMILNGYDEIYCRQFNHGYEADDWRARLESYIGPPFDRQNFNFCAIKMYHEKYAEKINNNCSKIKYPIDHVISNNGWDWGKLLDYSFSVINEVVREPEAHEEWIADNLNDVPNYVSHPAWEDVDKFMEELEAYANPGV